MESGSAPNVSRSKIAGSSIEESIDGVVNTRPPFTDDDDPNGDGARNFDSDYVTSPAKTVSTNASASLTSEEDGPPPTADSKQGEEGDAHIVEEEDLPASTAEAHKPQTGTAEEVSEDETNVWHTLNAKPDKVAASLSRGVDDDMDVVEDLTEGNNIEENAKEDVKDDTPEEEGRFNKTQSILDVWLDVEEKADQARRAILEEYSKQSGDDDDDDVESPEKTVPLEEKAHEVAQVGLAAEDSSSNNNSNSNNKSKSNNRSTAKNGEETRTPDEGFGTEERVSSSKGSESTGEEKQDSAAVATTTAMAMTATTATTATVEEAKTSETAATASAVRDNPESESGAVVAEEEKADAESAWKPLIIMAQQASGPATGSAISLIVDETLEPPLSPKLKKIRSAKSRTARRNRRLSRRLARQQKRHSLSNSSEFSGEDASELAEEASRKSSSARTLFRHIARKALIREKYRMAMEERERRALADAGREEAERLGIERVSLKKKVEEVAGVRAFVVRAIRKAAQMAEEEKRTREEREVEAKYEDDAFDTDPDLTPIYEEEDASLRDVRSIREDEADTNDTEMNMAVHRDRGGGQGAANFASPKTRTKNLIIAGILSKAREMREAGVKGSIVQRDDDAEQASGGNPASPPENLVVVAGLLARSEEIDELEAVERAIHENVDDRQVLSNDMLVTKTNRKDLIIAGMLAKAKELKALETLGSVDKEDEKEGSYSRTNKKKAIVVGLLAKAKELKQLQEMESITQKEDREASGNKPNSPVNKKKLLITGLLAKAKELKELEAMEKERSQVGAENDSDSNDALALKTGRKNLIIAGILARAKELKEMEVMESTIPKDIDRIDSGDNLSSSDNKKSLIVAGLLAKARELREEEVTESTVQEDDKDNDAGFHPPSLKTSRRNLIVAGLLEKAREMAVRTAERSSRRRSAGASLEKDDESPELKGSDDDDDIIDGDFATSDDDNDDVVTENKAEKSSRNHFRAMIQGVLFARMLDNRKKKIMEGVGGPNENSDDDIDRKVESEAEADFNKTIQEAIQRDLDLFNKGPEEVEAEEKRRVDNESPYLPTPSRTRSRMRCVWCSQ